MWLSPAIQHTRGPLGARRGRTAVVAGGTSAYAERGKTFEGQSPLRGSTILRISGAADNRRSKAQGMLTIARGITKGSPAGLRLYMPFGMTRAWLNGASY